MATQTLETPPNFPGTEDVEKGDTKKFLVEVKCTDKEDDGEMEWEVLSIDGVKLDGSESEDEDDGVSEDYDTSGDEDTDEDVSSDGKAKTTKGVGMLILSGKPK